MAVVASFGTGRFTASPIATGFSAGTPSYDAVYYESTLYDLSHPPVIFMGGGGTLPNNTTNAFSSGGAQIVTALMNAGYVVFQPGVAWLLGNDESADRVNDAVNYGVSFGCDGSRPPVSCGISNGGLASLKWGLNYEAAGIGLFTTPVDLQEARDNMDYVEETLADLRGKIDAAYGVTYPAPLPAGANPYERRSEFLGTRIQQWFSTDDVIGARQQEAFACYVDADMRSVGRLGHTVQAADAVSGSEFVDFVQKCFEAAE